MFSFLTDAPPPRRTLFFGSTMHVWNDLFVALMVPLLPLIKEDMNLSFTEVGLLRSVFGGATAVLQIPVGFLAESMGEFWLLIWGNSWVALGLVAMALSSVFVILLITSMIAGLGAGAQHPLASSMVSRAYDDKGRATAVGTVNFAGDLGKMIAPIVAGVIAIQFGWRAALWAVGVAGVIFMMLSMTVRRSVDIARPERGASHETDGADNNTLMGGFITLSGIGFLDSATRGASLVFLPFVMDAKDMSAAQISAMLFLLFAGGAAGKFVCGWLGDRYGVVNVIWGTKGLTALLLVVSLWASPLAIAPLMVVLGIGLNGTSSALYATVADFVPAHRRARLYGVYYTTNEGGTVLAPIVYGLIADLSSLNVTMIVMGIATAFILPASLTLRRYLSPGSATVGRAEA